jgi:hypothetical protein
MALKSKFFQKISLQRYQEAQEPKHTWRSTPAPEATTQVPDGLSVSLRGCRRPIRSYNPPKEPSELVRRSKIKTHHQWVVTHVPTLEHSISEAGKVVALPATLVTDVAEAKMPRWKAQQLERKRTGAIALVERLPDAVILSAKQFDSSPPEGIIRAGMLEYSISTDDAVSTIHFWMGVYSKTKEIAILAGGVEKDRDGMDAISGAIVERNQEGREVLGKITRQQVLDKAMVVYRGQMMLILYPVTSISSRDAPEISRKFKQAEVVTSHTSVGEQSDDSHEMSELVCISEHQLQHLIKRAVGTDSVGPSERDGINYPMWRNDAEFLSGISFDFLK